MADGTGKYETIDIASFTGLYADKVGTQEDFPSTASPYAKNFIMQDGILHARKGRRRINDTAYDSRITTLIPYIDRNKIEHLVFSVESDSELLETLDGTVKVESNVGLRKPLVSVFSVMEQTGITLADRVKDFKIRNGYIYLLRKFPTMSSSQIEKWTLDGEYVGKHSGILNTATGQHNCFEVDSDGNLYLPQEAGDPTQTKVVKYAFGGSTELANVVVDSVDGCLPHSMYIDGTTLYLGWHKYAGTGETHLDSFDLNLGSQTNLYSAADSTYIKDIAVTDEGHIILVRRNSAGTTREIRYYDGTVWTNDLGGFFNYLPSKLKVQEDKIYVSFVDDTTTGDSQAAFYVYDQHWNYLERMGSAYLSTATKNKSWDISTQVLGNTASVETGDILFDVDDEYIYVVDGITDASYPSGILFVVKKFRR